jgi:hypothetical protein
LKGATMWSFDLKLVEDQQINRDVHHAAQQPAYAH